MTRSTELPAERSLVSAGGTRQNRSRLLIRQLLNTALNFLFPPQCIECRRRVGSLLCLECQSKIPPVAPLREADSPLIERRATAEFGGAIQKAIHAFKYSGQFAYGEVLGQRLVAELKRSDWQPTLISAVPLHESRLRERGYNQSALLAEYLAAASNLPFHPQAVARVRETRQQVGLNAKERHANVAGAFQADPALVSGQSIVVVDDVYTTGSTLRACASALLEAGASQVWALTVACAKGDQTPPIQ